MVRLGIVTCLWQRPRLTRLFLRYWAEMEIPGITFRRVAVTSSDDPYQRKRAPGWKLIEYANFPLASKFNAGFRALRGQVDAVMIVGSDDFACTGYVLETARRLGEGGKGWVMPTGLYVYDAVKCKMLYLARRRIGTGRVLSAELLDRCDWCPYLGTGGNIDGDMINHFTMLQVETKRRTGWVDPVFTPAETLDLQAADIALVDIKTPISKWPYSHFEGIKAGDICPFSFFARYFPYLSDELLDTRKWK